MIEVDSKYNVRNVHTELQQRTRQFDADSLCSTVWALVRSGHRVPGEALDAVSARLQQQVRCRACRSPGLLGARAAETCRCAAGCRGHSCSVRPVTCLASAASVLHKACRTWRKV